MSGGRVFPAGGDDLLQIGDGRGHSFGQQHTRRVQHHLVHPGGPVPGERFGDLPRGAGDDDLMVQERGRARRRVVGVDGDARATQHRGVGRSPEVFPGRGERDPSGVPAGAGHGHLDARRDPGPYGPVGGPLTPCGALGRRGGQHPLDVARRGHPGDGHIRHGTRGTYHPRPKHSGTDLDAGDAGMAERQQPAVEPVVGPVVLDPFAVEQSPDRGRTVVHRRAGTGVRAAPGPAPKE